LNGSELIPKVVTGVQFIDGELASHFSRYGKRSGSAAGPPAEFGAHTGSETF
jgi:hypothetical protein